MNNLDVTLENRVYLQSQIQERYNKTGLGDPDGLTKINSGMNRTVYKITNDTYGTDAVGMVVKVQHPTATENREEVAAWEQFKNTRTEKYLVPIVDYAERYEWVLMPYGEPVPDEMVDLELVELLRDQNGTDISKDDFIYMEGNAANQRCCDYASL